MAAAPGTVFFIADGRRAGYGFYATDNRRGGNATLIGFRYQLLLARERCRGNVRRIGSPRAAAAKLRSVSWTERCIPVVLVRIDRCLDILCYMLHAYWVAI